MQSSSSYHHQSNRKLHVGKSSAPKKIAKIQFGTLSTVDIQLVSGTIIITTTIITIITIIIIIRITSK